MKRFHCHTLLALSVVFAWGGGTSIQAQTYANTVLADHPVAYYRLGETSGNTALDSSGNNLHGAIVGNVTLGGEGAILSDTNTSMRFTSGYIDLGRSGSRPLLDFAGKSFSVETWIKPTSRPPEQVFFSMVSSGMNRNYHLRVYANGIIRVGYWDDDADSTLPVITSIGNTWYHVVTTYDASSDTTRLFINGTQVPTTNSHAGPFLGQDVRIQIGTWNSAGSQFFQGYIDEVAIYNRVLSPDRIQVHYRIATVPAPVTVSGTVALEGRIHKQAQPLFFGFQPIGDGDAFFRSLLLQAHSTFRLDDIPRGRYSVWIKGDKWLAKSVLIDTTKAHPSKVEVLLPAGDANNDNFVDVLDLDLLIAAFDSKEGDPNWNAGADLNCDDSVDMLDLNLLIKNFDMVGDF